MTDLTLVVNETVEQVINRIFNTPDTKHKIKKAFHVLQKGHKLGHNIAIARIAIAQDLPPKLVKDIVENPKTQTLPVLIDREYGVNRRLVRVYTHEELNLVQ